MVKIAVIVYETLEVRIQVILKTLTLSATQEKTTRRDINIPFIRMSLPTQTFPDIGFFLAIFLLYPITYLGLL